LNSAGEPAKILHFQAHSVAFTFYFINGFFTLNCAAHSFTFADCPFWSEGQSPLTSNNKSINHAFVNG